MLFTTQLNPKGAVKLLSMLTASFMALPALADNEQEYGGDTEFDIQAMQARGVDTKLADWFSQAPRFMPGETSVVLTVNGSTRGKVKARFDESGKICADADFQKKAGLISPPGFSEKTACFDLKSAWPQTELNLDPGEGRVDLVVPGQAVSASGTESGNWQHGGFAGMFNYDGQYMDSSGPSGGVNFTQLGTEAGFNFSDWIVRSRQTFSRFNDENLLRHQAAYAQRSFAGIEKVLQAGQISLSNSLFGTGQVLGFQMFPEAALVGDRGGAGLVEGTADTQSVVEIRQSGVLMYSTIVPAGPFRLQGFSLLNTRSDLEVVMTGSNGETRQFTVPAASLLLNGNAVAPGLSLGAGKLDQQSSSESPILGTLANGWLLTPRTTLNAGILGSEPYRAGALGVDNQPFDATLLTVQATVAQNQKHGNNGVSTTASVNQSLSERLAVNINASYQTSGYSELSDALQDDELDYQYRTRSQYGTGVSWAVENVGNLSLSWARTSSFNGNNTDYLRSSWSRQFGRTFVSASAERNTNNRNNEAENRLYLTMNIPFDGRSVSSYVNSTDRGTRAGVRYSDRTSQDRGWSIASERDFRNERFSNTGSIDRLTSISQLSGSVSHDSDNSTTWSARASGGVVAHNGGITLSPYPIQDTFGIAKVGEEAGVQLDTPAGPTWTDRKGYAVLPSLSSYKRSTIQVKTTSLRKDVDIDNALQETEAARGSVSHVNFDVVRSRRVLVDAADAQGKALSQGSSVFDSKGKFVTVVGDHGRVFVPDAATNMVLEVQSSGKTICSLTLILPEKADAGELYETASAVCK